MQPRAAAAHVALGHGEGRTRDGTARAEGAQRRAHERRLARAQLAMQSHHGRRPQKARQHTAEATCDHRRGQVDGDHLEQAELLSRPRVDASSGGRERTRVDRPLHRRSGALAGRFGQRRLGQR